MERISDTMGSPEQPKTVVFVRIDGDANGAVLLLVNPNDINTLLSNVDGKLRISALEEITNIISGASLGGLSRLLNMKFHQSITLNTTDMLRAVVNEIITDIGITNSEILCFAINLKVGVNPISISLYLLFDEKTSSLILTSGKNQMENKHADTN
jgi:chemotaxis protein CheC